MNRKKESAVEVQVTKVVQETATFYLVGTTPLVINRMAAKAKEQLLLGSLRKNAVEKQTTLKHNPREEFNSAAHKLPDGPTLLGMPSTAFKKCLSSAAVDLPGVAKAQLGRLTYVEGRYVSVYGLPLLYMDVVRNSDPGRTPDIRTRPIIPEWAAIVRVTYVRPLLTGSAVGNCLGNGGIYIGVGDGRQEKGCFSNGLFRLCVKGAKDPDFARIVKAGGRKAQEQAMQMCEPWDDQTKELLAWFDVEVKRRSLVPAKTNGAVPHEEDDTEQPSLSL